jgi:hypothetical protein
MTAPIVPPTGLYPASPGRREDTRDHLARLRQQGGTYRSIAAAAVLSPATVYALAFGSRRAQSGTATAVLTVTSLTLSWARLDATGTGCGCAPCTSWATARPASPAPPASTR